MREEATPAVILWSENRPLRAVVFVDLAGGVTVRVTSPTDLAGGDSPGRCWGGVPGRCWRGVPG